MTVLTGITYQLALSFMELTALLSYKLLISKNTPLFQSLAQTLNLSQFSLNVDLDKVMLCLLFYTTLLSTLFFATSTNLAELNIWPKSFKSLSIC